METWPVSTYVAVDLRPRDEYLRRVAEIPFFQENRARRGPRRSNRRPPSRWRRLEQPELVGRRRWPLVLGGGSWLRGRIPQPPRGIQLAPGRSIVGPGGRRGGPPAPPP